MKQKPKSRTVQVSDGGRATERVLQGLMLLGALAVLYAAVRLLDPFDAPAQVSDEPVPAARRAAPPEEVIPTTLPAAAVQGGSTVAPPPEVAPMPQDRAGIAVFNPMGTKPIKRGLVVPDDFELPPGYVRHHQMLDDGRELPAVLMFHPDTPPLDEAGQPIPVPPDRMVPPEHAPPGLPLEYLQLPDDVGPEGGG